MTTQASNDVVKVEDITTGESKVIKRVILNAPKSLNSLSLEMIRFLQPRLKAWDNDPNVVCIFLEGAGEKAFCAGGDIVQIYRFMTDGAHDNYRQADSYFIEEYVLDYTLHTLNTPLVTWADGITMGGGLGMSVAGSHRVVTDKTRMTMPEITIGLYPDVGSTWFLPRMPRKSGLFLGMTGAHLNAGDALFTGLADVFLPGSMHESVLASLRQINNWSQPHRAVGAVLTQLGQAHQEARPPSRVHQHLDMIDNCVQNDDLSATLTAIEHLQDNDDPWLARASKTYLAGCPVTAHLLYHQMHKGRYLSLAEAFQQELAMTTHCIRNPDFREGVRALLIDKDGHPQWKYKTLDDVPAEYIQAHFTPTWQGEHPMAAFLSRK